MTDREMLLLAYGALKALGKTQNIIELIEKHLYPPKVEPEAEVAGYSPGEEPWECDRVKTELTRLAE